VAFTAEDGCGNSVTRSATFYIVDSTGPSIVRGAKDAAYAYGTGSENNGRFSSWLATRAGATADDVCAESTSLVWTVSPAQPFLPSTCDGMGSDDECKCTVPVTWCVTDCSGKEACTKATFR